MEKLDHKTAPVVLLIGLLILQATFSFSQTTQGSLKAHPDTPPAIDVNAVPWLPFNENWSTGLFETNKWVTDGSNWWIAGQSGNEAPTAEFFNYPAATNYQQSLTSRWLSGRDLIDGEIYLSFDLKLATVNTTGLEVLKYQVCTDTSWVTIAADSNKTGFNWIEKKLNLTTLVKGKIFKIRFLAEGQNSLDILNWQVDNILVYRKCKPPLNLHCMVNPPYGEDFTITWKAPGTPSSDWIFWDSGENNDAIGLGDGGNFFVASRFTPAQLINNSGAVLNAIRLFPYEAGGTIELKVWQGANAAQLIYSQAVTSYIPGQWNEFLLESPVSIDNTNELWFGYSITHPAGVNIAGCDGGPVESGFGDMISLDGITWVSMATEYDIYYNWNLQGLLITPAEMNPVAAIPAAEVAINKNLNKIPRKGNLLRLTGTPHSIKATSGNRELIRYDIYDCYADTVFIGSTTDTVYIFEPVNHPDGYCFFVSAVYADCRANSDACESYFPKSGLKTNPIEIFPVPSDGVLYISVKQPLIQLQITDFYNKTVAAYKNPETGEMNLNTAQFQNGLYLIRTLTEKGDVYTTKFIVNH